MKAVVVLALAACGRVDPAADSSPAPATGKCVVAMSGLGGPACVLRSDGRIACWGSNANGEIGDGTMLPHVDPTLLDLQGVTDIATGEFHACAIMGDATARCWGKNDAGQVGDGTISRRLSPTPVYMTQSVAQIATGQSHTCARHNDGRVSCWGSATAGAVGTLGTSLLTPTPVTGIANVTKLTVGDEISCAVTGDRAHCWGDDGTLGDGSQVDRASPGPVALPDARVIDIAAGCHRHVCALLEDGTAWCWGDNSVNQLGDGTRTPSRVPVKVAGNVRFTDISAGAGHSCGLDPSGSAWCWGNNSAQQIDDAPMRAPQPRRIVLPMPVDQVEAGCARSCARAGDRVWCWGDDEITATPMPRPVHEIPIPCPTS